MNNPTTPPPYRPKKKKSKPLLIILRIFLGLIALAAFGLSIYYGEKTLFDLWIPWCAAAFLALPASFILGIKWHLVTGSRSAWINYAICFIFMTGIFSSSIFIANYSISSPSSIKEVKTIVTARYTKTRYHTKRIGRRMSGKGKPYKVYYIEVTLPDGRKKEFNVPLSQYNKTRKGSKLIMNVEKGLFMMPVVKQTAILKESKSKSR